MSIYCPACSQSLSSEGDLPKFCSNCGASIDPATVQSQVSPTEHGELTQTLFPNQSPTNLTEADAFETLAHGTTKRQPSTAYPAISNTDKIKMGDQIGPFEIFRKLGQGGMGSVYEATHRETGQRVALKLLTRSLRTTDETIQRFQRESQIAASINHPRSTFVYQAGQHEGQFYITMELMPGGTLSDIVKEEGGMPIERAVDYVLDMISGLQAAHEAGIVHRDLKPSNCFVDENDRVKIGDFGLAKSFLGDSSLTQTGTFMGTPQFAAPEQLRAADVDERTDIYAIGGTLFYLLSGRAPFTGNAAQVIASIASDTAPKIATVVKDVPRELSRLIQLTLEKDPARRPENLEAVRLALLPFSSRGATTVDLGRRIAAFFIDVMAVIMIIMMLAQILGMFLPLFSFDFKFVTYLSMILSVFTGIFYFAIQEKLFGRTLGKWLMKMRVVDKRNHSPGWGPAFLRATINPGTSYILGQLLAYALGFDPSVIESEEDVRMMLEFQLISYVKWVPCLLCFVYARESNGYLGFHEWITGTRVVRLAGALDSRRPRDVAVTLPVQYDTSDSIESIGAYRSIGKLGCNSDLTTPVMLGHDAGLDREVMMLACEPVSEVRKSISRPTRLRILAEWNDGNANWMITEAVKGIPLSEFVANQSRLEWRSFRPLLREIVYELAKGLEDKTIPDNLDLQSIWIDQSGRSRVLDHPVFPSAGEFQPENRSPIKLVKAILDTFIEHQVAPVHVLQLREEIETAPSDSKSLRQIGQRLGELANNPSAWRWDDRFGVMAISATLELGLGLSLAWMLTLFAGFYYKVPVGSLVVASFVTSSIVALLSGGFLGGGLAFRMTGVALRKNKTLKAASPIRCAFRCWVAWLPMIALGALFAVLTLELTQILISDSFMGTELAPTFIAASLAMPALMALAGIGSAYALLRPSRGVQDLIAGTRLVRK